MVKGRRGDFPKTSFKNERPDKISAVRPPRFRESISLSNNVYKSPWGCFLPNGDPKAFLSILDDKGLLIAEQFAPLSI